jgi:hypothetical protein
MVQSTTECGGEDQGSKTDPTILFRLAWAVEDYNSSKPCQFGRLRVSPLGTPCRVVSPSVRVCKDCHRVTEIQNETIWQVPRYSGRVLSKQCLVIWKVLFQPSFMAYEMVIASRC